MASPSGPKWLDVYDTPYGGGASKAANGFLLGLTALSLAACLAITLKTRRCIAFSSVLCVAYILEIAAYALRFQPWAYVAFAANFSLSTLAPILITISIHLQTADVLASLGPQHALLSPNLHLRLFICGDLFLLLLQAVALGVTFSGARAAGPWGLLLTGAGHTGQTLLFAALLLQTLLLAAALGLLATAYARAGSADRRYGRYATFSQSQQDQGKHHQPQPHHGARSTVALAALPVATACVLVRCAYRAAASWGGLGSPLARDQIAWLLAEGLPLTEAVVSLAAFHPAVWTTAASGGACNNGGGGGSSTAGDGLYDVERSARAPSSVFLGKGAGVESKRLSSGTTMTAMGSPPGYYHGGMAMAQHGLSDDDDPAAAAAAAREANALSPPSLFSSNLIAASDAGSSTDGGSSRRGSRVLDANPYYRFEEEEDHSPHCADRYSQDLTAAETRRLSPLEAEAEEERLEAQSTVAPLRQPSSRNGTMVSSCSSGADKQQQQQRDDDDSWEVESIVLPPRMPSKRDPHRPHRPSTREEEEEEEEEEKEDQDDELEDAAMSSTYSSSLYPSRTGTMRAATAASEDDWEVGSFVLPPRMPSKRVPGGAAAAAAARLVLAQAARQDSRRQLEDGELERSDSMSLYSQY